MTDAPPIQYTKTADGFSIAYQVFGEGPQAVWASSYWASNLTAHWSQPVVRDALKALASSLTIIKYDGRGSGLSQREPFEFSLEARVADLEAVVERASSSPFALVASGHACLGAAAFAVSHPDRVSHLILRAPYPRGAELYEVSAAMKLGASLRDVSVDQWEFVTLTIAQRFLGHDSPRVQEVARLYRAAMTPEGMFAFREATRGIDITSLLPQVKAKTLVLTDDEDHFTPISVSQEVASAIPGAELRITPRSTGFLGNADIAAIQSFLGVPVHVPEGTPVPSEQRAGDVHTILWTDVEGSTALTDRLGDAAAREVLREHERITREALKAHGGSEVKTMGDGFMASFGSATKALECAVAIQRSMEQGTGNMDGVRVRCGLNAGEPIAEDDPGGRADLHGTAVIVAARIAAQAQGGEILVSDVVRQLVAGKGFLFNDRGEHALKGFEDPVRVYEVSWRA